MLKPAYSMKKIAPRAVEVLRGLLGKVPILQVKSIEAEAVSGDGGTDLIARLLMDGRPHQIICDYRSNGQPRYARSALLRAMALRA